MGGNADGAVQILKELRVPYIKPFCLTKITEQRWQEASAVNPGEFLISMLLPELDGGILTFPVGVMGDATVSELQPITERIDTLVARLEGYLRLQKLNNQDKSSQSYSTIIRRAKAMLHPRHFLIPLHRRQKL